MGIANPFAKLARYMGSGQQSTTTTIAPRPASVNTTIITQNPESEPLAQVATPYDLEIAAIRRKVDSIEGSKPVGIDGFKFVLMRWGAAILPVIAAIAVGDIVAHFFVGIGFDVFSAYSLSFVLELVTMLLTYAISHALSYRVGKNLNIPALLLTIAIWLLFLAAQCVLLIAIGGAHPGTLVFVAIVLRSAETALACTAAAIVAYWTKGKSMEEELSILQRKQNAFQALHGAAMDMHRAEQRAANQQRQEEQHLAEMQRNSDMLIEIGEKIGGAVLKMMDRVVKQIDEGGRDGRNW